MTNLCGTNPQAHLLASGAGLMLEVIQFHHELPMIIHAGHIHEVKRIEVGVNCLEIGAVTPLTDCYQVLAVDYPDLSELLQRFASLQIRNQDILGGNIGNAPPIDDAPSLPIALGVKIILCRGERRRELPPEECFLGYKVAARGEDEFIERTLVPCARSSQAFRAYKTPKCIDGDIPAVCVVISSDLKDGRTARVRVAFGGAVVIPRRAAACETALQGARLEAASFEHAVAALADDSTPLSDLRTSKEYCLLVAQNLLRKCSLELYTSAVETRVTAYV